MRIAYIPMHTQVDIFFQLASSTRLSAEWRIGVIQTLTQMGHQVEVCGKVETQQKKILDLIKGGNLPLAGTFLRDPKQYLFYKDVKFNETGYPTKPDLIIVEGGTTNSFHTRRLGADTIPIQLYAYEAIVRHEGRVFWFCPEPNYAFRFGDLCLPTGNAAPATDLRRLLYSSKKFLEGKRFAFLMTDHDKEAFRKRSGIPKDFPLEQIAFTPYSLADPEICNPVMDLCPIDKLKWDVVYIGHLSGDAEKKRREQLERLLTGAADFGLRCATYGNIEEGWSIPGVQHFPKTVNMGQARGILNESLLTPLVIRKDFIETQHESNRQCQAAQCGSICLWPEEVRWMLGSYRNEVRNAKEVLACVDAYSSSEELRKAAIDMSRSDLARFRSWFPSVLSLEGAPVEDVWGKDLEPYVDTSSPPTLL